ncbi:hypothetical protein ABQ428_24235 [Citrobacter freundii]|uniref:hypothetical protein n=1 Tax=Citrobacter freundii TaxID=546 RepID=UPI003AAD6C42
MLEAFQEAAFNQVAEEIKHKYPDNTLVLTYAHSPVIEDFMILNRAGKLKWDPWLKNQPFFQPEHTHPIRLAVYYRRTPLGYAFGNFSAERQSLEICWIEKRLDAHADMDEQMLPIALTCFSAYGMLLRKQGHEINKIAWSVRLKTLELTTISMQSSDTSQIMTGLSVLWFLMS